LKPRCVSYAATIEATLKREVRLRARVRGRGRVMG
tara:strand:- start:788 stop:892 length:105 start_codon:yes stop_codon:yes gene_type:complete